MSQRQFNIVRACFWLVAFVIGAHVVAVLTAEMACLYYVEAIIEGKAKCDVDGRLTEVLAGALAAALAFAGGHIAAAPKKPDNEPNPDDPDGV